MELDLGAGRARRPARRTASRWCASAPTRTASRSTLDVAAERRHASTADELKLKQVVLNLLSNAVKFTPDGGAVVGDGAARRATRSHVSVARHGHRASPQADQRADLRGLPARRPRRARTARGHRPRPHALAPHRRAARRPSLAGERAPASAARSRSRSPPRPRRSPARRRAPPSAAPPPRRRRAVLVDRGRPPLGRPAARLPRGRRLRGRDRARRRRGARAGAAARRRSAVILDILLPRLTAGRCSRELKGDPATAGDPGRDRLDARRARRRASPSAPRSTSSSRSTSDELLDALARCVAPPRRAGARVVVDRRRARSISSSSRRRWRRWVDGACARRAARRASSWCGASAPRSCSSTC